MNKFMNLLFSLLFAVIVVKANAQVTVSSLACEYQKCPIGLDIITPHLSWILSSKRRNCFQTAYRVIVSDDSMALLKNVGNIWDSKKTFSSQSIQISFSGKKLISAKTYYWKVMVWDNYGNASAWSMISNWQMGLLTSIDWKNAKWIGYEKMVDSLKIIPGIGNPGDSRWNKGSDILPLMRKELNVKKEIKKATIFITGLGQFELSINGNKIGDHFLDPGWTLYSKQALYITFDITQKLKKGINAFGVALGNGFYYIPGERYHKFRDAYGYPKMICRVLIEYQDGSTENMISDETWKAAPGPVTFSSIYGGEDYNASLLQKGWDEPGFNDNMFKNAVIVNGPSLLESQSEEPLKVFDQFPVKKITQPKPGIWVYDMGQNASAIPFLKVKGKRGSVIKITPAELLDDNGMALQAAVGSPVYFNYTMKGDELETWHPEFMYYGFRYIQIEGAVPDTDENTEKLPVIVELKSLHTRNSAATIGTFNCSSDLFNKTFKLIDWAIKSNTASIFTDCPHREKLGWLEEAYLVGSSIRYNYNIATLCRKVISDMRISQTSAGLIPNIAPEYVEFDDSFRDSPEWGSNGIIMPWYVYQWYGDKRVLKENYNMMTRYATYLGKKAKNHILYFGLGDWYDLGPKDPGPSQLTPTGITSTATYYYDLKLLSKMAHILHRDNDAKQFEELSFEVKKSYNNVFFNPKTYQYGTGSQTANAISIYMGLVGNNDKPKVLANLITDIRKHNNGITTGDIGYRYLLRVLDEAGRSDIIYDMNNRSDVPGYGYQIAHGATSLTESWQGNRISSNNHFMLGHLMEWFYSGLGGISIDTSQIAFKKIIIRPEPVGDINHVKVTFLSPYGIIKNEWTKTHKVFNMDVSIPVNTTAIIYLPAGVNSLITESGNSIKRNCNLKLLSRKNGKIIIKAESGNYSIKVRN